MKKTGEASVIQTEKETIVMDKDAMSNIEATLYQIHGLAVFLAEAAWHIDEVALVENKTSNPLHTLGAVLREKTEYCLGQIPDEI